MDKIFGSKKAKKEGGEYWMSVSDLMAGLMMVFLFISVALMRNAMNERDKIKEVAVTYNQTQQALYAALHKEFEKDLTKWGAELDRESLSLNFKSPDVLFANGDSRLSPKFKLILANFFPRYLSILDKFKASIQEIRIEGHTSSAWNYDSSDEEAYFNNMMLSQTRTRSVLKYLMELPSVKKNDYQWVKANVAAVGYSSSKLITMDNGREDAERSRRVSFRVITNAETQIRKILVGGN